MAIDLITRYYDFFNAGISERKNFLALLHEDVVHHLNQGGEERGIKAFEKFMQVMDHHYLERVLDLVVMRNLEGSRAAAEFVIEGTYLVTQKGLPVATKQKYRLPVGAFFEIKDGLILRVTNYYNLQDWIQQVSTK